MLIITTVHKTSEEFSEFQAIFGKVSETHQRQNKNKMSGHKEKF